MFTRGWFGSIDYGSKDFSDFRENYGRDKTLEINSKICVQASKCWYNETVFEQEHTS